MNFEKVKYKLTNNDTKNSIWLENDPKNWDKSERTLKRSTKTFGVYTELSKNLEFVLDGADFLKEAYFFKGGEADVTLYEYRFNPNTSHPYLHSTGTFDFSKYKADDLSVKVPFKTGGLNALISSQTKEKFEIERLESINGNIIDAIDKKTVALTSRDILLVSQLKTNKSDALSKSFRMNYSDGNYRSASLAIPTEITIKSDENLGYVIRDGSFTTNPSIGNSTSMFYFNNDIDKDLEIKIKVFCKIDEVKIDDLSNGFLGVSLARFEGGTTPTLLSRNSLYDVPINSANNHVIDFEYSETISLIAGQSLSLQWYGGGNFGGFLNDGDLKVNFEETNAIIDITENSQREDSKIQAVLLNDLGEKLMQIITGEKGRFYSDFYTNGDFKLTALTTGFWIRQFEYIIETIEGKEVPKYAMQISLSNLINTSNVIHNTGYHIETVKGCEALVIEDLKYYFQEGTALKLGEVSDYEEENADDFCHSSLEFGYKKGGDYDEAQGLDEYNIKTGFTTPLKRVDTKYTKISDARADSYAKEFARRKPKLTHGTTDTSYDKDLHLLDLKTGLGEALEERIYSDDFEDVPKGVYSPSTATNLRLTPSQIEKRHEWFYGSGVIKHQDDKIRYSNTEGNNSLSTKESGKLARSERDDIDIKNLNKARFEPIWLTFQHPLDYDVTTKLNGKTNVNGRDIPNVYFKVEFTYKGKTERGYIFQVQQKKTDLAEFKLLKAI